LKLKDGLKKHLGEELIRERDLAVNLAHKKPKVLGFFYIKDTK
jgi:hypothetical protein